MQVNPLELEYRWLEAVKSYEQLLDSGKESKEKTAEYWQRIGYCYSLASRQEEDVESFTRLRQLSVEAYQKAAKFYELGIDEKAAGNSFHCFALAELNRSWIASSPLEKNEILVGCREFGKKALNSFSNVKAVLNLGETCNTLAMCILDHQSILKNAGEKRIVLQEALGYTSEAITIFSKLESIDNLVFSLSLSSIIITILKDVSVQRKWTELSKTSLEQASKAAELTKRTENPYAIAVSRWAEAISTIEFGETIQKTNSLEYPLEMLRQATRVGDKYLAGIAYQLLANTLYHISLEEDDPNERKQYYKDTIKYSENSIKNLKVVSQYADIALAHAYYIEACSFLAREFATTRSEKKTTFKRGIKIGEVGIEYATRSGAPVALWACFHGLSKAFHYFSALETRKDEKVKLLEKALEYRQNAMKEIKKALESNVWFTGIDMVYSAQIEAELATLEEKNDKKIVLFGIAMKNMERAVLQCKKQLDFFVVPEVTTSVAENEEILGRMQEESYFLTNNKENLLESNTSYDSSARNFKSVNMPSRAAESYWKIAINLDRLGEYQKANENFRKAFVEYKLTMKKIPQFRDFYFNYATYMEAWSEIEKAKLAHSHEKFDEAEKYYEETSKLVEQSKFWSYMSLIFHSWSLLERAEDLSRKDKNEESVSIFRKALESFQQSKRSLIGKMFEIEQKDEKDQIKRLIEVSNVRERYSQGRIAIEEAKTLDKQGDHASSSDRYRTAATIFKGLLRVDSEQIENETKPLFYLCKGWEKMTMAKAKVSPEMYKQAAELFKMASKYAKNESTSLLALAHGSFCKALEAGTIFEMTRNVAMYTEANKYMNAAAGYYLKAGFEVFSEYTTATQRLFDSYVFMDKAKREADPEKVAKYYLMAERVLQMSADSFARAKYKEKAEEVQRLLRKVKADKDLAMSLNEVFRAPIITSAPASFDSLSLSEEKAVGLERLEKASVLAKLVTQEKTGKIGQDITIIIQVVNVGKERVLLTKIEDIAPMGFQLIDKPDHSFFENSNLVFKGKQLSPSMTVDEIKIVLTPFKKGIAVIKPRIVYVDEIGRQLFHCPEPLTLDISETILPDRVTTGSPDLDGLLLGGIPENYSVLLMSPSSDERQIFIEKFVETGVQCKQTTFYVTTKGASAKTLTKEFQTNLHLFMCNSKAEAITEDLPNVYNLGGVENLTNIDISIAKALRMLDASSVGTRRACIEIVSDVLLMHRAVITQKWLSQLLAELKTSGFTTLAILNPQMHPLEDVHAILELFEGEVQICEKESSQGLERFLRVRKLRGKRYLDAELLLTKKSFEGIFAQINP